MITVRAIKMDERELKVTFSDSYHIRKDGTDEIYTEAIDVAYATCVYHETEKRLTDEDLINRQHVFAFIGYDPSSEGAAT